MVNTPIPHSLKSEARKAAKILRDFSIPNAKVGPDKIIPAGLIMRAHGLAILTVAKIGFLVTARGGSGIVIAKLSCGGWSAPSAIGIAGLGGGFEIGAEVTDFVIILNTRSAVDAFSKGGNLTLGGNFTIAVGPLGRNAEADVSVRSPSAIYTYSKTKGLFAGISIEGSALIERKDANKKFYHESIRAYDILNGNVDHPTNCSELYDVLENHEEMFEKAMKAMAKREVRKYTERQTRKAAQSNPMLRKAMSFRSTTTKKTTTRKSNGPGSSWSIESGSYQEGTTMTRSRSMMITSTRRTSESSYEPQRRSSLSSRASRPPRPHSIAQPVQQSASDSVWDAVPKCKAMYPYSAQLPCDLTFQRGDEIEILTRTEKENDWWEGKLRDQIGIFPANYVRVM